MKIAINCRTLNKRHGGPRRFLVNMLINLTEIDTKNEYFLFVDKEVSLSYVWPQNFKIINLETKSRLYYEYVKLPQYINKIKIDIFISPNPTFSPFIKAKKIAVYHDIIYFEKDREREFKFLDNLHDKIMIPISGKASDLIICVSNFTQERVNTLLGLHKTKVIYEGVEDSFFYRGEKEQDYVLKKYNISKPFLFYIGSMSPRKNIERIVDAFYEIQDTIKHNLYLIGGYSWNDKQILNKINSDNYSKKIKKIGHIEELDLPAIYSAADALVYPSLYEGFGLPIVEAQACKCLVITSNIGAMKEIVGVGGILVDPFNVNDISKAMLTTCKHMNTRDKLITNGTKNIKRFSWEKFTKELISQYEKI